MGTPFQRLHSRSFGAFPAFGLCEFVGVGVGVDVGVGVCVACGLSVSSGTSVAGDVPAGRVNPRSAAVVVAELGIDVDINCESASCVVA